MNLHSHSIISLVCLCRSFLITVSGCQGSLRCAFINSSLRRAGINYRRNDTHFTQKIPSSQILHNSGLRGVYWVGFERVVGGILRGCVGWSLGWVFTLRCAQSHKRRLKTCHVVFPSAPPHIRAQEHPFLTDVSKPMSHPQTASAIRLHGSLKQE